MSTLRVRTELLERLKEEQLVFAASPHDENGYNTAESYFERFVQYCPPAADPSWAMEELERSTVVVVGSSSHVGGEEGGETSHTNNNTGEENASRKGGRNVVRDFGGTRLPPMVWSPPGSGQCIFGTQPSDYL